MIFRGSILVVLTFVLVAPVFMSLYNTIKGNEKMVEMAGALTEEEDSSENDSSESESEKEKEKEMEKEYAIPDAFSGILPSIRESTVFFDLGYNLWTCILEFPTPPPKHL